MEEPKKSGNNKTILIVLVIVVVVCICIVVGSIVALSGLFTVSTVGIEKAQESQNETKAKFELQDINLDLASYYGEHGQYPQLLTDAGIKTTANGLPVYYQRIGLDKYTLYINLDSGKKFDLSNK